MVESLRILIICANYPTSSEPIRRVFVHETVKQLKRRGHSVLVVAPEKILSSVPRRRAYEGVNVLSPRFLSLSNLPVRNGISTFWLTCRFFYRCLRATFPAIRKFAPNIVYSQFLFPSGYSAGMLGNYFNIPSVLAIGESDFDLYRTAFPKSKIKESIHKQDRIITVSEALRQKIISEYYYNKKQIHYVPNAVNTEMFFDYDRTKARNELGVKSKKPIVIFVGNHSERKGPSRILKALAGLERVIDLVFIGPGCERLKGRNILFKGAIPHNVLPTWLNAADIFALPSVQEGMANAILEAAACGLSVISSNREFNAHLMGEKFCILIDPFNLVHLRESVLLLAKNDKLRKSMSVAARTFSSRYKLENRAKKIEEILRDCSESSALYLRNVRGSL